MAAPCILCNHERRIWAEEQVAIGVPVKTVAEAIGVHYQSVLRHFRNHYDVAKVLEAKRAELNAQPIPELVGPVEIVEPGARGELARLEAIIQRSDQIHALAAKWLDEMLRTGIKPPLPLVQLLQQTASEMRQAIKAKEELLGRDAESRKATAAENWVQVMQLAYQENHRRMDPGARARDDALVAGRPGALDARDPGLPAVVDATDYRRERSR